MTYTRLNALSLAVAVAISSSIMVTQALADRRLRTKFVGIDGNGRAELIQSEVVVKPTLGDDQQPIPKSFTTTYPDPAPFIADLVFPSFTDVLSGIDAGVAIVDLFETDDNDVAQKYTKILKVADEGVFRFTHNLEEKELVIEVRAGMTDQDSVEAVFDQMDCIEPLETFTKIARPAQLAEVLEGANDRAGKLGTRDHYVALATIEVEQVEVNGRTFMRLISGGDQPPELKRLGQSLFVNDEALLAAATSAYIQVHVLGEDLQQQALNELLKHSKPIGYVVHVEDDTYAYPVPEGYPKLEVKKTPGEVIVFHGQLQYPNDIAFVENLHKLMEKAENNYPAEALKTQVKSYDTRIYEYVIRSRQMALLEESAAHYEQHKTEFKLYPLARLIYYEYLRQALTSATPDNAYQFEFTFGHIKAAWSVITPTWLKFQLEKHFGFKPVIRKLLTNQRFIQTFMSVISRISKEEVGPPGVEKQFADKVISDMIRQLPETYKRLEELQTKEATILHIKNELQHLSDTEVTSEEEKLKAQQINQRIEDELVTLRVELEALGNREQDLQQESKQIPALAQQLRDARKAYYSERATKLGIGDWDDTLPPEEQAKRIREKLNEIFRAVTTTEQPEEDTVKTNLATIEGQLGIVPDNENDLDARFQSIQKHLQQSSSSYTIKTARIKARYLAIALHLNIQDFDIHADVHDQEKSLLKKIEAMHAQEAVQRQQLKTMDDQLDKQYAFIKATKAVLAGALGIDLIEDTALKDRTSLESMLRNKLYDLSKLENELKDIKTPGHPKVMPEVLEKLTAVESVLNINDPDTENDVHYRRDAISKEIQRYIKETRQRVEEEALEMLIAVEKALEINVNEGDDKATRLDRIEIKINNDDISESMLDTIEQIPWKVYTAVAQKTVAQKTVAQKTVAQKRTSKYDKLTSLAFYIEAADRRAVRKQERLLKDIEDRLQIYPIANDAAKERGKTFLAKLANDLGLMFENDVHLNDNKYAIDCKISELMDEVEETYGDEEIRRGRNNEMAHQLNIEDYKDDASIENQNILIIKKLKQLDKEVSKAGVAEVNEHITVIENELDRQMARLGPKPRYVLDREVATIRRAIEEAESEQKTAKQKLDAIHTRQCFFTGTPAVSGGRSDEIDTALNQIMEIAQTGLGLTASDEQTLEERVEDIKHFLQGHSKERRNEIFKELRAQIHLDIKTTGDTHLQEVVDYFVDTLVYVDTLVQEAEDEFSEALDEQTLTGQKHSQVTEFLREHDRKSMEVTSTRLEERNAQANLDRKKQEIEDLGDIDEQDKTAHDEEMAALDLVLEQKSEALSKAEEALTDYHKAVLNTIEEAVGLEPEATDTQEQRVNALRNKQLQLGRDDVVSSRVRQLIQEEARLEGEIEIRKADIERKKDALAVAEKAVENDDGPFQYTPRQAKVRAAMDDFMQEHPLKQQALETAIGLAGLAAESGNAIPILASFNFIDEFAPIRLQTMVGDHLTLVQASQAVEIFKYMMRCSPPYPLSIVDHPVLPKVQELVYRARNEMKTGAQRYDDEIHGMSKRAFHPLVPERFFSEHFATHSHTGIRIIALLSKGLISKVELHNYIKAVRGVDGYQTVDEFEHFLGYRYGVNVPQFKKVVQMMSDEGAKEFMRNAFDPVTVTTTGPSGMKESVTGMKEYAAAVIANYVLNDIAFNNGRRTAAFLANIQDTLAPYANTLGVSESELIKAIHDTLMQAHAAAVEHRLNDYWLKPSASLVQAAVWYFFTYKPLLAIHTAEQAERLSLSNMAFLYLLDLTSRGDYLHRALTPFEHWLEHYDVDLDRTRQYTYHDGIEKISEVGGLAMPLGKAASSVILLRTGSLLFARQYNANPRMYRSISRLVPEMMKSMTSGQGVQIPLVHRITPEKVKTLASATAGLVLGPVATVGSYAHGLLSGFTYAQTFGFALASSLTFDFFMNDNKMLTQWLGGPLGRSLDKINRWIGMGETESDYVKRTAITTPQRFNETDEEYTNRVKANNMMYGWTRNENYLQFRERRDRTMMMYEHGWEKYFRDNVPKWSFSHAESIPYSYTLDVFYDWQMGDDQKVHGH